MPTLSDSVDGKKPTVHTKYAYKLLSWSTVQPNAQDRSRVFFLMKGKEKKKSVVDKP